MTVKRKNENLKLHIGTLKNLSLVDAISPKNKLLDNKGQISSTGQLIIN